MGIIYCKNTPLQALKVNSLLAPFVGGLRMLEGASPLDLGHCTTKGGRKINRILPIFPNPCSPLLNLSFDSGPVSS